MKNPEKLSDIDLVKIENTLMEAARIGDIQNIQKILKSTDSFCWNKINEEGETALIIAILSNQKEVVKTICNACEKLEDAKLIKSQVLAFKFSDEESLNHYAIHRINNVIFQLKMKELLIPKSAPIIPNFSRLP